MDVHHTSCDHLNGRIGADTLYDVCLQGVIHNIGCDNFIAFMTMFYADELPTKTRRLLALQRGGGEALIKDVPVAEGAGQPVPVGVDWKTYNRGNRSASFKWVMTKPMIRMFVAFMLTLAFHIHLRSELLGSSQRFSHRTWTRVVPGTLDGVRALIGDRKWPLIPVLDGSRDNDTIERHNAAQVPSLYDCLSSRYKTVEFRNMMFRIATRGAAYFYEYVVMYHKLPPFPLLRVAIDESAAPAALAQCPDYTIPSQLLSSVTWAIHPPAFFLVWQCWSLSWL